MQFFRRALHLLIRSRTSWMLFLIWWMLPWAHVASPQSNPLISSRDLALIGTKTDVVNYKGRKAVDLTQDRSARAIALTLALGRRGRFPFQPGILPPSELSLYGQTDNREVRQSIDQGNQQYISAFRQKDAAAAANVYDERGSRLYPKGVVVRGREAIKADLERFFKQAGPVTVTLETLDLWVTDDLAYETGKWSYTYQPQGQDRKTIGGRHVRVWKKQGDGTWKILAGMGLT
jgi:uncharacterized protein (TIGR02246 family)